MESRNIVFIGASLDGYIADRNGGLDWLHSIYNPDKLDFGYEEFIIGIDALVMGRLTFQTVCGFGGEWPYKKPVFVLSKTLKSIPEKYKDKAFIIKGSLTEIIDNLNLKGFNKLYIDGGTTIQNFLKEDLIDEMIITTIPTLLGGGSTLFGELPKELDFELVDSKVYLNAIVQFSYKRKRL